MTRKSPLHHLFHFFHQRYQRVFLFFTFALYLLNVGLVWLDQLHIFRWLSLLIYVSSIIAIVIAFLKAQSQKKILSHNTQKTEILTLAGLLLFASLTNFIFLNDYPFVSLGDEVRDSGQNAADIVNGKLTTFFEYGNYDGFGYIIPVFASFFYRIFGPTALSYRVPAALISTLEVAIFYTLLRLQFKRSTAALGALVYASLPLHLFYARNELVIAFDHFWTTLILLIFYLCLRSQRTINYVLLGTVLGISMQYHTAVRVVAVLIAFVTVAQLLIARRKPWRIKLKQTLVLIIFCLIGFGPMILYSSTKTFFQSSRLSLPNIAEKRDTVPAPERLEGKYRKSLLVWIYEPTMSRYPAHQPIFSAPLAILFLVGIASYVLKKKKTLFSGVILLLVLVIPFTNSAMTDWINADHRLTVLLPIGTLFVAKGISVLSTRLTNKTVRLTSAAVFGFFLLVMTLHFFTSASANDSRPINVYLPMHMIYFVKANTPRLFPIQTANNRICVVVSPDNFSNLDLLHQKEQWRYFLPDHSITIQLDKELLDNEAYLFSNICPRNYRSVATQKYTVSCAEKNSFYCPKDFHDQITINY